MNRIFTSIIKTSKILILIISIFLIQKVNIINDNSKISNENLNKTMDLTAMAYKLNEIQMEDKYYPLDTFTGDLTGYVADCPLCTGYLSCTGEYVGNGKTTYYDEDYGNVAILASSKNLPCGSIVTLSENKYGIVLDRGVLGTDLDLLVSNVTDAYNVGRKKITYDVLRFGYER